MQCKALLHATLNVVGALLRLRLVTANRHGIVKGEASFFAPQARNCKQSVIQASSPLTIKIYNYVAQLLACEVKFKSPCLPLWIKEIYKFN